MRVTAERKREREHPSLFPPSVEQEETAILVYLDNPLIPGISFLFYTNEIADAPASRCEARETRKKEQEGLRKDL